MTAIIKAITITQDDLLGSLNEEDRNAPFAKRNAAMVLTAVHQAVTKYASEKKQ